MLLQIPVVATIIQKMCENGTYSLQILPPDENPTPPSKSNSFSNSLTKNVKRTLRKISPVVSSHSNKLLSNAKNILSFSVTGNSTTLPLVSSSTILTSTGGGLPSTIDAFLSQDVDDLNPVSVNESSGIQQTSQSICGIPSSALTRLVANMPNISSNSVSMNSASLIVDCSVDVTPSINELVTTSSLPGTYLSVGSSESSSADLPSEILSSQIGGQVLSLGSDIVSDSVIEEEVDSTPSLGILSSDEGALTIGSGALTLPSEGVSLDPQDIIGSGVDLTTAADSLKDSAFQKWRYLCATGAPGEFEMVDPDDPRVTHVVNEFGHLQEVISAPTDGNGMLSDSKMDASDINDTRATSPTGPLDGLTANISETVLATSYGSQIVCTDGLITSEGNVATSDGGILPSNSLTLSFDKPEDEPHTVTLSDGGSTITVEDGGTPMAVENFAAILGVLQRAGMVPMELTQGEESAENIMISSHGDIINEEVRILCMVRVNYLTTNVF